MTDSTKEGALSKGLRIYEYTDQDGNVFWSFEKFPSVVKHARTLTLGDRVGTHFDNFLSDLRAYRRLLLEDEKGKTLGDG